MKKALISLNESPIKHITSWNNITPIYSNYENSCRVAEVCDFEFEVSQPLFWIDCEDNVVADQFYYDTVNQTINPIVNAPMPDPIQPVTDGLQTA